MYIHYTLLCYNVQLSVAYLFLLFNIVLWRFAQVDPQSCSSVEVVASLSNIPSC